MKREYTHIFFAVVITAIVVFGLTYWAANRDSLGTTSTEGTNQTADGSGNTNAANTNSTAVNTNSSEPKFVKLFFVALEDNGTSGEKIGCDDSIVAVETPAPGNAPVLMPFAIQQLVSIHDEKYGTSELYNGLYQSDLRVENISVEKNQATIQLNGTLTVGGVCDAPRIKAQLEKTALQFPEVESVVFFVNGQPLDAALSTKE